MTRSWEKETFLLKINRWARDVLELGSEFLPASDEIPQDIVVITLEPDSQQRERMATALFVPVDEEEIKHIDLLQLYVEGPLQVPEAARATFQELASTINQTVALGAFSLNDAGSLIFKYVFPINRLSELDRDGFLDLFNIWIYTLDHISGLVEEIISGDKDLAAAREFLLA